MNLKELTPKGQGYFCIVKKCIDTNNGNEYARKELLKKHYDNDDFRHRLLREIQLLQDLSGCENIIELISHGHNVEDQKLWYLMPCADQNLYEFIKRNNTKLSIEHRFLITDQIINAIKFAHNKDILHRDLAPNNVLVFNRDSKIFVQVCDFGLGKNEESISYYTKSSVNGYGQILYVSPEQREQLKASTKESDIYSLGKLIYFIFTGKDPIQIKSCKLESIVTIATSDNRYKSIDELENHYNSIKKLLLGKEIPFKYLTITDFLAQKNDFDWNTFYEIVTNGNLGSSHIYHTFINPIVTLFIDTNKIQVFYQTIGKERFINFLNLFSEKLLSECFGSFGWPFSSIASFGRFFRDIYAKISDDEAKLICLKNLWYIAYVSDNWETQRLIKSIFQRYEIPESIHAQFADYIAQSETNIETSEFEGMNLPMSIKLGIIEANEISERKANANKQRDDIFEF